MILKCVCACREAIYQDTFNGRMNFLTFRPFFFFCVHISDLQHAKNSESCCEKHIATGKDTKELKSKKPNWSIKLNCAKLKGIKSLSSSFSQECKLNKKLMEYS